MKTGPLSFAVIGAESLGASLPFYRISSGWKRARKPGGKAFEAGWHLPPGANARAVLLSSGASEIGRILLVEVSGAPRERIRGSERRHYGHLSLSFYCHDLRAACKGLEEHGSTPWSRPREYEMRPSSGRPKELLFDGPDGVALCLVELAGGSAGTSVGELRRFVSGHGRTPRGFSEVVTAAHCVRSVDEALELYRDHLGLELMLDRVVAHAEDHRQLGLPEGARSRVAFLKGGYFLGKVALVEPVNYDVPDLVERAAPSSIGYLMPGFEVRDLGSLERGWKGAGHAPWSPAFELELPGIGRARSLVVRAPGGGALVQLFEPISPS